jgi:predicted RNA-binding protein with PUA-like domain
MAYWLFKSEPDDWSWDQQKARGKAGEEWSGIRNYQARNNLRAMKVGDRGFFYHSNTGKEIVGIVEVTATARPDPTDKTGQWVSVHVRALRDLPSPVSIADIKAHPRLKNMALVRNSRLSVQPVNPDEWRIVCEMGGLDSSARSS